MRKLVTLRTIKEVKDIQGADLIQEFVVDGWSVVSEKGAFKPNDTIIYFECDSFLPETDLRFEKFMKFGQNTFEGQRGHRVKTKRIKGIFSQGIIMPVSAFPEIVNPEFDTDYSELLGIRKYEKQEMTGYQGDTAGDFPYFLVKSDQPRIQNELRLFHGDTEELFVGTLKMDGSSITVAYIDLNEHYRFETPEVICSRNKRLKYQPEVPFEEQGKFFQGAFNSGLFNKAKALHDLYGDYFAIQGELVGAGIQGNFEKIEKYQVFAYNIFNITKKQFVSYELFEEMANAVQLQIVPVIYQKMPILKYSLQEILKMADGKGLYAPFREGLVWKSLKGNTQFKAISNKYLEKED